jgi:uncharacterized OB-fold protein
MGMSVSMQRCPACGTTNQAISQYCERCGSLLKTSSASAGGEVEYTIPSMQMPPPPPPSSDPYQTVASSPYTVPYISGNMQQDEKAYYHAGQKAPATQSIGSKVLSIILYLLGAFSTALGSFGALDSFVGDSWAAACLLAVLLLCSFVLAVVLIRHHSPHFRWGQRLLWWFGVSGLVTLLTMFSYGILDERWNGAIPDATENVLFGSAFICYGLLTMFLALW